MRIFREGLIYRESLSDLFILEILREKLFIHREVCYNKK